MENPKTGQERVFRDDPPGAELCFSGEDRRKLFCNQESFMRSFYSPLQSKLVVNHVDASVNYMSQKKGYFALWHPGGCNLRNEEGANHWTF